MLKNVATPDLSIPPDTLPTVYLSLLIDIAARATANQMALCEILTFLRQQMENPIAALDSYQKWSQEFAEELRVAVLAKWGE
jgi:hypothetical protein